MLSELRETNRKLREKLQNLKSESLNQTEKRSGFSAPRKMLDASTGSSKTTENRRKGSADCPAPCSGHSMMLSDRAKYIRGEATKRIDNLFHEWRDFKDKTDEELRRRIQSEHNLKEIVCRKDREINEMSREICCLKTTLKDQKGVIDQLNQELDTEEKCRNRCCDLEMQIAKLNRHISELNGELEADAKCRTRCSQLELQIGQLNRHIAELNDEIRVREELIRSTEAEKNSLSAVNADLRDKNADQKRKIEMCEHDVNETRMELEILEETVRALNERRQNIFSPARGQMEGPMTPGMERGPVGFEYPQAIPVQRYSRPMTPVGVYPQQSFPQGSTQPRPAAPVVTSDEARAREIAQRMSAMSTLKNLQKEHSEKCDDLAARIQTLKDENKMKESMISELKSVKM